MTRRNKALGRGLGALIDDQKYESKNPVSAGVSEVDINLIEVNPFQPRTEFDENALRELASSIAQLGIIQPITLRRIDNDKYQIISGERRFRASKLAGLSAIPAYVREANDQSMLEFALVENIQREDLNAIEIALSYQRLMEECQLTQEAMADRVGKKRSTVANYLRLLKLSDKIQVAVRDQLLSMGHARALLAVEDTFKQVELFNKVVKEELSVRKTEDLVRKLNQPEEKEEKAPAEMPEMHSEAELRLKNQLQADIQLSRSADGRGRIVIPFKSDTDFERIIDLLRQGE